MDNRVPAGSERASDLAPVEELQHNTSEVLEAAPERLFVLELAAAAEGFGVCGLLSFCSPGIEGLGLQIVIAQVPA